MFTKEILEEIKANKFRKQLQKAELRNRRIHRFEIGKVAYSLYFDRNGGLYNMFPKEPELLNKFRGNTVLCIPKIVEILEDGYIKTNNVYIEY